MPCNSAVETPVHQSPVLVAGHYWDSNDYSTDPWLVVMQLSCSQIQLVAGPAFGITSFKGD